MRGLVSAMALRSPYRTKFRVFTGKACRPLPDSATLPFPLSSSRLLFKHRERSLTPHGAGRTLLLTNACPAAAEDAQVLWLIS